MKIYDKDIYSKDKKIESVIIVLVCFLLGFAVGCMAINGELHNKNIEIQKQNKERQEHIVELEQILEEKEVKINEQYIELDSLRETVHMFNLYGK